MRLAALVLLAASAIAVPTRHPDLRPLERDLRDMEVAIEALHAKAAHKALRLEKMDDAPLTITVRVFDEAGKKTFYETEFVEVTLSNSEGQHTVGKLREIIAKDRKWPSGGDIAKSPVFKEKTDEKNVLDEEKVLEDDEEVLVATGYFTDFPASLP